MVRHKRQPKLSKVRTEQFLEAATQFHLSLMECHFALRTNSDQYRSLSELHEALLGAIRDVTGDDPPWCKCGPGLHG